MEHGYNRMSTILTGYSIPYSESSNPVFSDTETKTDNNTSE